MRILNGVVVFAVAGVGLVFFPEFFEFAQFIEVVDDGFCALEFLAFIDEERSLGIGAKVFGDIALLGYFDSFMRKGHILEVVFDALAAFTIR